MHEREPSSPLYAGKRGGFDGFSIEDHGQDRCLLKCNALKESVMLSKRTDPKASTLAQFAEALNYELVLRSKEDGFEFVIDE